MRLHKLRLAVLGLALLLAGASQALAGIAGVYEVKGKNPSGQAYEGRATVKSDQGVYHVVWKIGKSRHVGTGLLKDDQFSVVYKSAQRKDQRPGLVVYEMQDDGSMVGVYVGLGSNDMGREQWRPAGRTQ